MADIIKFDVTADDLLKLAQKALEEDDLVKHIDALKRALKADPNCTEASVRLAQAYSALGVYDISCDVIFDALSRGVNDKERAVCYTQLAMNYFDEEEPEVAEYYLRDYSDDFDVYYPEEDDAPKLRLVRPHGEDYYAGLVEKAYTLIKERRFNDAMELMDQVDDDSRSKEAADHLLLMCLMMRNDVDAVIDNAKRILLKRDSLMVRCTLATAYLMEGKTDEARALVDEMLKREYKSVEEMLLLLPLFVNMDMHAEVALYARRILAERNWQPNTMTWLSVALYNLGDRAEARKVMRQVDTLYGDYSPAAYYLKLYAEEPEHVDYGVSMPQQERSDRFRRIEKLMAMPLDIFADLLSSDSDDGERARELLEWALRDTGDELACLVAEKLTMAMSEWSEALFRRVLLRSGISYELMCVIFIGLLNGSSRNFKVSLVADDRYKEIEFVKPVAFFKTPEPLYGAVELALAEIAFTDEEPDTYIARLFDILADLIPEDEKDSTRIKRLHKICRLRNQHTMFGVLLGRVYEDDEDREHTLKRYSLDGRLYDKYWKIFYGEDDGGED